MTDTQRLATRVGATLTDASGDVLASVGYWQDATGHPITDPEEIARLDAQAPRDEYGDRLPVDILTDDGEWLPATIVAGHGGGTFLVKCRADGRMIGVRSDRIRPSTGA